ncbi:MAG: lytic murein transglycosylase B [Mariprofundaceae bacterium]
MFLNKPPFSHAGRRSLLRIMGLGPILLMLSLPLCAWAESGPTPAIDKGTLIDLLTRQTGFPRAKVQATLADAQFIPSVIERITTPYESRPYAEYRPLFVTSSMNKMGRAYLHEQQQVFNAVEKKYQVEAEVIAAILGLETRFGRHKGKDRILDSLYTLAAGFPRRSAFFTRELGELLLLSEEEKLKPNAVMGSYAGAFGATQFIPSSFRAYAVDEDGDGRRDVWGSVRDIIASVANYFHQHGWQHGRQVAFWLPGVKGDYPAAIQERSGKGFKSWSTLAELRQQMQGGLPKIPVDWRDDDKVTLIDMQTETGPRIALIHYNFYVITRWNRSYNYAMATTEVAAMLGCQTCKAG